MQSEERLAGSDLLKQFRNDWHVQLKQQLMDAGCDTDPNKPVN